MTTRRGFLPRPNQSEVFYLMQCALSEMPAEEALANIEASRQYAPPIVPPNVDGMRLGYLVMNSYIDGFVKEHD